jgi:Skp family chaperone for outer membrane proteins
MKHLLFVLFVFVGASTFAQTKIGHVNTQKLLDTLPSRKEAIKKFRTKTLDEFTDG